MIELANCIHCGLCLEACPTYRLLGDEAEGPRGRLRLMAEQKMGSELDLSSLDRCLGCRGCESVCPSGVPYGAHLEEARELRKASLRQRLLVDQVLSRPRALRAALPLARLIRTLGLVPLLPASLRAAVASIPLPAQGEARLPSRREGSVAILPGCAQSVLQPQVLGALSRLLEHLGETPFLASELGCCGALSAHQGSAELGQERRAKLAATLPEAPLLVAAAGCSAHLLEIAGAHDALDWLSRRAERFAFRPTARRVLYHPPCHHSHAQGLRGAAERILSRIPELSLLAATDPERCCGSAGSYSLLQPELATGVRAQKWDDLRREEPELVLSANPGCEIFLEAGRSASDPPVVNLYTFLAERLGSGQGNR